MKRIPELDGIRGVAIGLVLVWHFLVDGIEAPPATFLSYVQAAGRLTWSGVDLFFVLSGFLIGGILLDSRDSPGYFKTFYIRRFFRIIPIYATMLCLFYLFLRWDRPPENIGGPGLGIPWIAYFLFLQNFWMVKLNLFGLFGATWSLAVEEQFYLTLPATIRLLDPRRLPVLLGCVIIAAPVLRAALWHFWPQRFFAAFVLMPCRADALLLGVIGALLVRTESCRNWLERNSVTLVVALILLFSGAAFLTVLNRYSFTWTVGFTWMALLYLAVILFAVTQPGSWLAGCLRWRWLRGLGMIAYGVYLVHQAMFTLIFRALDGTWRLKPRFINTHEVRLTALALILTLALCTLSWRYFERPLVQLGHRYR